MMEVSQAANRLKQLLAESGFHMDHPDPRQGWEVFKQFANEPVNCADDTLHCEISTSERSGTERCYFVLSRRFEINDEEKFYDHLEIVRLIFVADPTEAVRQYRMSLSTVGYRSLDAYFVAVESLPAFQVVAADISWQCEVKAWTAGAT